MKRILSLGAGVQSSTIALMIARGELPPVDCAIFADTQREPRKVMEWLAWLETQLPFPVYRVSRGDLGADLIERAKTGKRAASIPAYTRSPEGKPGIVMRQCTGDYKIGPINKMIRQLAGNPRGKKAKVKTVEVLIGISLDEAIRMKPNPMPFAFTSWPLIDKRMTRWDCLQWMRANGYPEPPKSSCTFCPYHSDEHWRDMKANDAESWNEAVAMDATVRTMPGLKHQLFLHRSLKPLAEVDFRNAEDAGQIAMFGEECAGICGV